MVCGILELLCWFGLGIPCHGWVSGLVLRDLCVQALNCPGTRKNCNSDRQLQDNGLTYISDGYEHFRVLVALQDICVVSPVLSHGSGSVFPPFRRARVP